MAWIARGKDNCGLVQDSPGGRTHSVPALATHRGELWCLWSDPSGDLYYATGDNNLFQPRIQFPDQGIPVMAELAGILHAIIVRNTGDMVHYAFNDLDRIWTSPALLDREAGFHSRITLAFVAFHNKLFLTFIQDGTLYYSIWHHLPRDETAVWALPQTVCDVQVGGIPALFVLDGTLHVLCASSDEDREILGYAYDPDEDIWNSCDDVSEGKAASGVSATSYGDSAFLAFQEDGLDDTSHIIYMTEYKDGNWRAQEPIAGQASADPPQLSVLNGRINCIFNTNNESGELMWYSRSLLDYSLDSWMSNIPDETLLSNITIPGTHDSCATSNIPFVRTQYLSITKQLEAGIRFLDLRCRVHDDGELYLYHGGIPINLPWCLKLDNVMGEIWSFFEKSDATPTETVLVSIDNDDQSSDQPPSIFYAAVASHISKTPTYSDGTPRWITSRTTVSLGQARGKAVLLRRYRPDPAILPPERIGIDLSGWLNNNPDFTLQTPDGVTVNLQDKWQYSEIIPLIELIASKFAFVTNMLKKAEAAPAKHWFLNFTSAVGDPLAEGEIAESHWIAVGAHSYVVGKFVEGMNITTRRKFGWGIKTRYGVIAMDYPELPKDSDLIAWLIGTNM